jgi:hypothetical protein
VGVDDLAGGGDVVAPNELDPLDVSDRNYAHRPGFWRAGD